MSPQELIINKSIITWELDDKAGTSTILNGTYIEKGIIEIENKLWVKQGISVFSRVFQISINKFNSLYISFITSS